MNTSNVFLPSIDLDKNVMCSGFAKVKDYELSSHHCSDDLYTWVIYPFSLHLHVFIQALNLHRHVWIYNFSFRFQFINTGNWDILRQYWRMGRLVSEYSLKGHDLPCSYLHWAKQLRFVTMRRYQPRCPSNRISLRYHFLTLSLAALKFW